MSGLQVVASWLGYRMKKRSGKKSSPLDLLRVLDALLTELLAAEHLPATAFPSPTDVERQGPSVGNRDQHAFAFAPQE